MSEVSAHGPEAEGRAWVRLPVTVVCAGQELDVVVPGSLPVAELLPDLAAEVGLHEEGTTYAGWDLLTRDRRRLDPALGLTSQGVGAGERLLLTEIVETPPRVHDDLVEAMAETLTDRATPRAAAAGRTGLLAGGALSALGAWTMSQMGPSGPVAALAALLAVVLLAGAAVLARRSREPEAAAATARMALPYAAAAALLALAPGTPTSLAIVAAGWGLLMTGVVARLSLGGVGTPTTGRGPVRRPLSPAMLLGGLMVGGGLAARAAGDRWVTASAASAAAGGSIGGGRLVVGVAVIGLLLLVVATVRT